jgi:predicted ATPase
VESDLALGYASGHFEAQDGLQQAYKIIYEALRGCKAFQFDNTSSTADIRKSGYIEDASELHADAGNLAAFLYAMQRTYPKYYRRIVETVGLVFPQFGDFDLKPSSANERYILLNWREKKRPDYLFGPHQLSDGTLRFMALTTLLMQPPEKLPRVIIIDEPELGLHPFAITALAGMIHSAATHCQVVISTQSTRLVDEFDVGQIVIVEHDDKDDCTRCRRPDAQALKEWSEEYSTSELWEKNVLGGRP